MNSKKTNIILGVIVVILLAIIAYMYVINTKNNGKADNYTQSNLNHLINNKDEANDQVKADSTTESTANYLVYTNDKYGFTLNLPERWAGYKVTGVESEANFTYYFELKLQDTSRNTYGKPFAISVFTLDAWKKYKAESQIIPNYITENNKYVFAVSYAQDDGEYVGFSKMVPNEQYHGAIYDAQTIIIPSFKLIDTKETTDNKTYTNQTYKYSFEYPKQYNLKVNSDLSQYIVDRDYVSVIVGNKADETVSFSDFMFNKVKLICDADGKTASISCPKYASEPTSFKTTTGLTAYKLVFVKQTITINPSKTTNTNKTVYAVNLNGSSKNKLLLIVEPVDSDLTLAKNIALSVIKY